MYFSTIIILEKSFNTNGPAITFSSNSYCILKLYMSSGAVRSESYIILKEKIDNLEMEI